MNELQGKTLLPGLFDGPAHFVGLGAWAVGANLLASPDETANTIDDAIKKLKDRYEENGTGMANCSNFGMARTTLC